MAEEISFAERDRLLAQVRTGLFGSVLFRFSRSPIQEGSNDLLEFAARLLVVNPGCPLFLKRFHKHPSIGSAVFCAHKTVATSPCRWNNRALPRSRGIACLRFPSSKLPPDVPPTAARLPDQSALAPRAAPFAGAAMARLAEQFSRKDRFLAAEHCHRIPSRFL